jgi:hypothetical protein
MAKELFACTPIVLCIAFGTARPACASSPPDVPTKLEFDTRLLDPEVGARIESQLGVQIGPALVGTGYVVNGDRDAETATIRIRVVAFDVDARDYEIEVHVTRSGTEAIRGTIICNACSETRLVGRIVGDVLDLLETEEVAVTEAETGDSPREPAPEPRAARKTPRIGPLGIAGTVLGGVGIAAAIVGASFLSRGEIEIDDGSSTISRTNHRIPVGAACLVVGAGALFAGAAMTFVDVRQRWASRHTLALRLDRTYVGLQFQHRF